MKNKNLIILIIVALVVGYLMFFKPKTASASNSILPVADLGKTASGRQITEDMIAREVRVIMADKNWFNKVRTEAEKKGIDTNEALRLSAIYMLKNFH